MKIRNDLYYHNRKLLVIAAKKGSLEIVKYLLDQNIGCPSPDKIAEYHLIEKAYNAALYNGHFDVTDYIATLVK